VLAGADRGERRLEVRAARRRDAHDVDIRPRTSSSMLVVEKPMPYFLASRATGSAN